MMRFRNQIRAFFVVCTLLLVSAAGQETTVKIRGMTSKSEREVMTLIGGRLHYVKQKPANGWRANDAAFLVKNILRNDGFYEAEVSARIEGNRRIVLDVKEGLRLSLGKVEILGDPETKELAEIFSTPFESTTPFGAGSPPFRADDVPEGLDFVLRQLQSEGYWKAEVTLERQEIDKTTGDVNMTVRVDRGARFKIGEPTVDSPDGRGVKRSATTWQPFIGKWATTENVNGLRAAMVEAFTSRGYPDAKITMARRLGYDTFYPEFVIKLGVRVRLLEVHAEGLIRTQEKRVNQIMQPLEGEWYDEAAMNKKVKDLLQTGAFESVRLETYEVANKRIDATLHFTETKAKEITLSGGVDSFDGPLFRAKYTDRNFRGKLRGFSAGSEVSARGILGEITLTDPWWRGTEILRTHRLFSLIKAYDGYTSYRTGYESGWKMNLTEHYNMELLLGASVVVTNGKGLPSRLLGDMEYGLLNARFIQTWDHRDSPILPKSGWHVNLPLEVGIAGGSGSHPYWKAGLNGGAYFPLTKSWQLDFGGFANWVFPADDINNFPIDLRLFNGGARSVRSFPERELGPALGGDPYGGDFSWAVNTELSYGITGSLRAVAFVDAGGVTGEYTGSRQGGLELAAGLGLRIDLPIGPVRLEYGHNLTQGDAEPSGTFHFAIGATF